MNCPRCQVAFEGAEIEGVAFDLCPSCDGTLLAHAKMIPLLSALSAPIASDLVADAPIGSIPPPVGVTTCPKCARPMEVNGYMGTRHAYVTSCSTCGLVWFDADTLETVVLLHARTNKRVENFQRESREGGAEGDVFRRSKSYRP